jgi:hypothetical protein
VALYLPGWERYSIWGWDGREGSLFAQLWRNTDDRDAEPSIWITTLTGWPAVREPEVLAEWVSSATGCRLPDVLLAMAAHAPGSLSGHLRELAV